MKKRHIEPSDGLKLKEAIVIFFILAFIVILGFWIFVGWPSELPDKFSNQLEQKERLRAARLQFLTTIAAILGGIGVVFNLYYTGKREEAFNKSVIAANKSADAALKNAEAAQDKQITERFTKAVEQLASPEMAVRLGGIFALERIAKDSEKDHWTIMEVLTAFVREKRLLKKEEQAENEQLAKIPTDIQAALFVIGRRDIEKDPENQKLDLSNVSITGANLSKAKLKGANFYQANLQQANFNEANLQQANLNEAKLEGANLNEAKLEGAILTDTQLQGADLGKAKLQGANLGGAKLQGARLSEAKLQRACLQLADLQSTRLNHAQLQEANLRQANLQEADLNEANLKGAFIKLADFRKVRNLTLEQIRSAQEHDQAQLPDYLKTILYPRAD
jgi:hypothetical protein